MKTVKTDFQFRLVLKYRLKFEDGLQNTLLVKLSHFETHGGGGGGKEREILAVRSEKLTCSTPVTLAPAS